jgi:site-specific DNA-methyltransferase (adenine-specific)
MPSASVDAVVTDPPYAIGFDDQDWDRGVLSDPLGFQAFSETWAREAVRILKPGGHVLAFGSPRTFHRMVAGCEDAGLEIRDQLLWLHGRGVPKSKLLPGGVSTTLKPAYEPIMLARTPIGCTTAVQNVSEFGTGGLNIETTRIPRQGGTGYWPSHIVLNHEEGCDVVGACDPDGAVSALDARARERAESPARLFYVGKASRAEREAGLDQLPRSDSPVFGNGTALSRSRANVHPTVKPIDVMRWLVRLVTPVDGLILDPFSGSGSTGCAAIYERRRFLGIELDARYVPIARTRIAHALGLSA